MSFDPIITPTIAMESAALVAGGAEATAATLGTTGFVASSAGASFATAPWYSPFTSFLGETFKGFTWKDGIGAASGLFNAGSSYKQAQDMAAYQSSMMAWQNAQIEEDRRLGRMRAEQDALLREQQYTRDAASAFAQASNIYDPSTSGSFGTLLNEAEKKKNLDVGNIKLMGEAGARRYGTHISMNDNTAGYYRARAGSAGLTSLGMLLDTGRKAMA